MSEWKIIFFKIDSDQNTIRNICGESVVTCGLAELFPMGDSSNNKMVDLYMADRTIERFTCHKSIFTLNLDCIKESQEYIFVEEVKLKKSQIVLVDIPSKYNTLIENICKACCSTLKKYNTFDRYIFSFMFPIIKIRDVIDIYSTDNLHSAQAVVLILKAVLEQDDSMNVKIKDINSRCINSTRLHDILLNHSQIYEESIF